MHYVKAAVIYLLKTTYVTLPAVCHRRLHGKKSFQLPWLSCSVLHLHWRCLIAYHGGRTFKSSCCLLPLGHNLWIRILLGGMEVCRHSYCAVLCGVCRGLTKVQSSPRHHRPKGSCCRPFAPLDRIKWSPS